MIVRLLQCRCERCPSRSPAHSARESPRRAGRPLLAYSGGARKASFRVVNSRNKSSHGRQTVRRRLPIASPPRSGERGVLRSGIRENSDSPPPARVPLTRGRRWAGGAWSACFRSCLVIRLRPTGPVPIGPEPVVGSSLPIPRSFAAIEFLAVTKHRLYSARLEMKGLTVPSRPGGPTDPASVGPRLDATGRSSDH